MVNVSENACFQLSALFFFRAYNASKYSSYYGNTLGDFLKNATNNGTNTSSSGFYSTETKSYQQDQAGTTNSNNSNNNSRPEQQLLRGANNRSDCQENMGREENTRHQRKGSNSVTRDSSLDFPHDHVSVETQNASSVEANKSGHGKSGHRHKPDMSRAKSLGDIVEPLNAGRLRPIRQKTRNAVVSILEEGDVSLEFIQQKNGQEHVVEVFRISPNGMKILVFHPNGKKGVSLSSSPPEPPSSCENSYLFSSLPSKYWKKYQYAARFVQLVRRKTPKVGCILVTFM